MKHSPTAADTNPNVIMIFPIGFSHKLEKKFVDILTIPVIVFPASVNMLLVVIAEPSMIYHLSKNIVRLVLTRIYHIIFILSTQKG